MTNEEWKLVAGYPDYAVNAAGVVKRLTGGRGSRIGHALTPNIDKGGYLYVSLHRSKRSTSKKIHRIVAETFLLPDPIRTNVNHKNGIKTDNRVENLEWVTFTENIRHSFDAGLRDGSLGELHHTAKLTSDKVREIRRRYAAGESLPVITRTSGVNQTTVWKAICRRTWKHVA